MQDYLRRDGRAIAQPAFRILAWCDGSLNDPENAAMVEAALVAFGHIYGAETALIAIADHQRAPAPAAPNRAAIADAVAWLRTPDKRFAATLRMNGQPDVELGYPGIPHFRVDEDAGLVLLEIAVPVEQLRNAALAEAVTQVLTTTPLRAAVMGLGLYQPSRLSSHITFMPRVFTRYRCALEVQLTGPRDGIRKERSAYRYDQNTHVAPGLPDIGWRTLIGAPFAGELNDLPSHSAVTVTQIGSTQVVTAGAAPIWGDINLDEDISAYTAVAEWLKPLRYPVPVALNSLFGSQVGDPQGRDRVEAYLGRLDLQQNPERFDKVEPFE